MQIMSLHLKLSALYSDKDLQLFDTISKFWRIETSSTVELW